MTGRTGMRSGASTVPMPVATSDLVRPHDLAGVEAEAGDAAVVGLDRCDPRAADRAAGALERGRERGHQPPGVDRVVAGDVEREADGRRQRGLDTARLARAQALDLEAELAPEGERALERLGLVAVARDQQACRSGGGRDPRPRPRRARRRTRRTRARRADRARSRGRRRARPRPRARACRRPPPRRRGRRRRSPRCAGRGRPRATRRPCRSPRHPLWRGQSCSRSLLDIASLRRYYPDQVRRSAARCRPLSPCAGSRWFLPNGSCQTQLR